MVYNMRQKDNAPQRRVEDAALYDDTQDDAPAEPVTAPFTPDAVAVALEDAALSGANAAVAPTSAPRRGDQIVAALREMLETVIFALLVFLVVQAVSRNYMVQSISMQPTLYEGQYVVVNRLVYSNGRLVQELKSRLGRWAPAARVLNSLFHPPERGDVLVFVPINNSKPDLIKRVIGIAGDKVELRQGTLYINDQPINEPYIRQAPGQNYGPVIVGENQLFVMGDNRGNSSDSRVFGMLPLSHVVGRAWLRYWPPRDWGFIQHHNLSQQLAGSSS